MVPSLMSLGALKPYGDSLGERSSELLRICLLRTLTPLRGVQDQICTSLVRVMAPCSGGLGAGWPYWLPFGWAGKAGGRVGQFEKGADPVLGGLLCLNELCQISGSACATPMAARPVPTARFHRESAHSQAQAACEGLFLGGNGL